MKFSPLVNNQLIVMPTYSYLYVIEPNTLLYNHLIVSPIYFQRASAHEAMTDELVAIGVVAQQVEGLLHQQEESVVEILAQPCGQGVDVMQEIHVIGFWIGLMVW